MAPKTSTTVSPHRRLALAWFGSVLLFTVSATAACAQSAPPSVGEEVTPRSVLQLYDAPPSGVLGQTGNPAGKADPAKKYRVTKLTTFRNAVGRQFWVFLQQDAGPVAGWALAGDDADPVRNLKRQ